MVVGIDSFQNADWNFKFGVKDSLDFKNYLLKRANFNIDHIKTLNNQGATKSAINGALDWFAKNIKQDDLLVVYIRTRGISNKEKGFYSLATADTTFDSAAKNSIDMDNFVSDVMKSVHTKAYVFMIDADFSGKVYWSVFPTGNNLPIEKKSALSIITSTESGEICWESAATKNSVFTGELLKLLALCGKDVPIAKAAAAIEETVKARVNEISPYRVQTVGAIGMSGGGSPAIIITDSPTAPRSAP